MEVKVLVVDEIGLFTEPELTELSEWAVTNGVIVIGLGDPKQITPTVITKQSIQKREDGSIDVQDLNEKMISGIEDCMYFGSSMLTASLRSANLAKKDNFTEMDSILFDLWKKLSENRTLDIGTLDKLLPKSIKLSYYEDSSKLYGEKIVENDTDLIKEADKFKGRGTVAIIYDETNAGKYSGLTNHDNIEFIPYDEMQGREWTYILVDVDFSEKTPSQYMKLKHLYTVSQRSKEGSIIKTDKLITDTFDIDNGVSDPKMNQQISLTTNQITAFKDYRNNALKTIPEDNTFFNYFKPIIVPTPMAAPTSGVTPPVAPATSGAPSVPDTSGTIVVNTGATHRFLNHSSFESWELSQNSLAKKLGLSHISDLDNSTNSDVYKNTVAFIGSIVRKNGEIKGNNPIFNRLENIIGFDKVDNLKQYLTKKKTLQIVPFNGANKLLVARFGDASDFIDVPICIVKTEFVGQYNGNLQRKTELKFKFAKDGKYTTIREFLATNPGINVFPKAGVLICDESTYKQIENDPTLSPGAKKFLTLTNPNGKTNNGKLFVLFTDEISDLWEYSDVWMHPKDGNLISHYDQIRMAGVHKPLQLSDIVAYINAVEQGKSGQSINIASLISDGIWDDPSSPIEVLKSLDWASLPASNTSEFYKAVYGRKWQVIPTERAYLLSSMLLNIASQNNKYKSVMDSIICFLNTFIEPSQKVEWETHGIVLTNGDKSIFVMSRWNDDKLQGYDVFDYNPKTKSIVWSSKRPLSITGMNFPYKMLCDTYLNGSTNKIELKRFVKYRGKNQTLVDLSPNDQLFILLNDVSRNVNTLNELNETLQKTPSFVNSIYMDDIAKSNNRTRIRGSKFFAEFEGDFMDYVISVESVEYSTYAIDEKLITSAPSVTVVDPLTERFNQFKSELSKLQAFAEKNHISISVPGDSIIMSNLKTKTAYEIIDDIINDFNSKYKFSPNSWISTSIVKSDGDEYSIVKSEDVQGWLEQKTSDIGNNINILNNYLNSKKYIIFAINTSEGNKIMIARNIRGSYEISKFNSYDTFKDVLELAKSNQAMFAEIQNYIHSLVYDYGSTTTDYASKAFDWLINNRETPEVAQMFMLINNHLTSRLNNNEC